MGFFKKLFRPVAKVFDKIIPNEIKPALPYLAAFAPMLLPQAGIMSSMLGRGLMSGGLNIGAQLAQEGNEGDVNALSALLAGGIGALSAPGAGDTLRGGTMAQDPSMLTREGVMSQMSNAPMGANSLDAAQPFLSRTGDSALNFLAKGADKLSAVNTAGAANPFSMDGLKAAALPFAQGTGDVMYQEGVNSLKDYEIALRDYENSLAEGQFASDSGRRAAIINAMTGNHTQEVIDQTLAELGLRDGGRVNAMGGGIMSNQRGLVNQPGGYAGDYVGSSDNETIEDEYDSYIKEIEIDGDTPMSFSSFKKMIESDYAKGGRVGFKGGGMDFGEEYIMIEGEDGPIRIKKSDYESMPGMFMDTTTSLYGDASRGRPVPDFSEENNEPDFGGIKEAIENVDIKEKGENLEDVGKLIESSDESILRKFLTSKLVQEGRYALSEFLMNDPILFGTPDKFKDGKNNKRGTFNRDSSEYDKLSKEKQAYIEAFLNSDEGQLFLKPGKISFPVDQEMRDHNKNYDEQQTINEYFPDSQANMQFKNY